MKKVLVLLILILTLILSSCKNKDVSYYCQMTGRNIGGYEVWEVVDSYEVDDGIVKLYKENGTILEYDLENIIVLCTEMEEIE